METPPLNPAADASLHEGGPVLPNPVRASALIPAETHTDTSITHRLPCSIVRTRGHPRRRARLDWRWSLPAGRPQRSQLRSQAASQRAPDPTARTPLLHRGSTGATGGGEKPLMCGNLAPSRLRGEGPYLGHHLVAVWTCARALIWTVCRQLPASSYQKCLCGAALCKHHR